MSELTLYRSCPHHLLCFASLSGLQSLLGFNRGFLIEITQITDFSQKGNRGGGRTIISQKGKEKSSL